MSKYIYICFLRDITRSCFYCSISLCFLVKFRVGAVLQSNQSLNIDESFMVDVGIMHDAEAGGGGDGSARRKAITNTDTTSEDCSIKKKRSMVFIPDVEGEYLCAGRAIVTCMAKLKNMNKKEYNMIISHRNVHSANPKSQRMRAIRLYLDTGMSMRRAVPVTELSRFEKKLGIQIVVISGDMGNTVIYKGFKVMKDKIFLYLKDQHYHSIVNINGFYVNKKLCQQCLTTYARKVKHSCRFMCKTCGEQVCMFGEDSLACPDCNMCAATPSAIFYTRRPGSTKLVQRKAKNAYHFVTLFTDVKSAQKLSIRQRETLNLISVASGSADAVVNMWLTTICVTTELRNLRSRREGSFIMILKPVKIQSYNVKMVTLANLFLTFLTVTQINCVQSVENVSTVKGVIAVYRDICLTTLSASQHVTHVKMTLSNTIRSVRTAVTGVQSVEHVTKTVSPNHCAPMVCVACANVCLKVWTHAVISVNG